MANPEEINLEDMPDHVENPEEINLDNDGDDDDGMAPIERPGGMFDAVEIHGSAVVGKHEL